MADMQQRDPVAVEEFTFTAIFEPAEEGGYAVTVPALPGVVTEGESLEEARDMAADAIRCYLESLREDGLPLPSSEESEPKALRAEKVTVRLRAE